MLCVQLHAVTGSQHCWGLRGRKAEKRLLGNGGRWGRAHLAWEDFPGKERDLRLESQLPTVRQT